MIKTGYKIVFLVAIASVAAYLSLTTSAVLGLSLLAISPLLLCLITCGIAGGVISGATWFSRSKTKKELLDGNREKKIRGMLLDGEDS